MTTKDVLAVPGLSDIFIHTEEPVAETAEAPAVSSEAAALRDLGFDLPTDPVGPESFASITSKDEAAEAVVPADEPILAVMGEDGALHLASEVVVTVDEFTPLTEAQRTDLTDGTGAFNDTRTDKDYPTIFKAMGAPTGVRSVDRYSLSAHENSLIAKVFTKRAPVLGFLPAVPTSSPEVDDSKSLDYRRALWDLYSGGTFGRTAAVAVPVVAPPALTSESAEEPIAAPIAAPVVPLGTVIDYTKPRTRPNGEQYFPRTLALPDKETKLDMEVIHQSFRAGIPILLYGEPGTGKTAAVEAILDGLITISGTADTEVADFVGGYVQTEDGKFLWVDGPLVRAMEEGRPLLIDEVALIDSRVMAVVYSVMDGRGELVVTQNPMRGTVRAKTGFYVIGACNPNVPGAVMSEALLSRFILQYEYNTDYTMLNRKLGVSPQIIAVARNLAKKVATGEVMKAPQARELLGFKKISEVFGEKMALANFVSAALESDREVYTAQIAATYGFEVKPLATK